MIRSFFIFNISTTISIKTRLIYSYYVVEEVEVKVIVIKKKRDVNVVIEITIEIEIVIIIFKKIENVDVVSFESLDTIIIISI